MHDKFTERVRKVIYLAREEAARLQHDYIGTEHLLLGIIREGEGIAADGAQQPRARPRPDPPGGREHGRAPSGGTHDHRRDPVHAARQARARAGGRGGALARPQLRRHRAPAARASSARARAWPRKVLLELGVDRKRVREETLKLLGGTPPAGERRSAKEKRRDAGPRPVRPRPHRSWPARASSTRSSAARRRSSASSRSCRRRKKNNPVLIGEPGVGKTAIVEGLAQRIVEGKVPEILKDKRIVHPRPGRGRRRHQVPRPVRGAPQGGHERDPRVEGRRSSSSTSCTPSSAPAAPRAPSTPPTCSSRRWRAASCSASAPPRSTSTASTSRRTARSSGASSRSWSTRPSVEETIEILKGLRDKYEAHHRVKITDEAIVRPSSSPTATSPTASCPTRPST